MGVCCKGVGTRGPEVQNCMMMKLSSPHIRTAPALHRHGWLRARTHPCPKTSFNLGGGGPFGLFFQGCRATCRTQERTPNSRTTHFLTLIAESLKRKPRAVLGAQMCRGFRGLSSNKATATGSILAGGNMASFPHFRVFGLGVHDPLLGL